MGLNVGQAVRDAAGGVVDYGGSRGRTAPRDRAPSAGWVASPSANYRDEWRGGGVLAQQPQNPDPRTAPRDRFAPAQAAPPPARGPENPNLAAAAPPPARGPAPPVDPMGNLMNRPSPVDELMGYTRMGSMTRPTSPTSGGPSGIPKGGP